MAMRPIFFPSENENIFVEEKLVKFKWYPGYSIGQKQKSIVSLHQSIEKIGINSILEISTKSLTVFGKSLSAFNLQIQVSNEYFISVESAYQGSKVFENGGPFCDLFGKNGFEIKKDSRLKESGKLIGFNYQGDLWDLTPSTAFYDWLYINAIVNDPDIRSKLVSYNCFTDIEFNPQKSLSCQARSAALCVSLIRRGLLEKYIYSKNLFIKLYENNNYLENKPKKRVKKGKNLDVNNYKLF